MQMVNMLKCGNCGTVLVSLHRHDFVQCGCDNQTFNDGGFDYSRGGGKDLNKILRLVIHNDQKGNPNWAEWKPITE